MHFSIKIGKAEAMAADLHLRTIEMVRCKHRTCGGPGTILMLLLCSLVTFSHMDFQG